jgi:hypothetical protein
MTAPYGRDSRYRRTPVVTRVDHTGRTLQVDDIRIRPATPGRFDHTVDGADRLDALGQRYYDKPHKWWPIADANPEFASPLALLGLDAIVGVRVSIGDLGDELWHLLAQLRDQHGVEDVTYDDTALPWSVTIVYNRATTDADTLVDLVMRFRAAGPHESRDFQLLSRAGKPVVVPPETAP